MQFQVVDLGLVDFRAAWQYQKDISRSIRDDKAESVLIVCRHYPVITLGRQADKRNIVVGLPELKRLGIEVYEIERGGDVTYHGPGQIIAYPVFDLGGLKRDIRFFLRRLEDVGIDLLADFGVDTCRLPGLTGIWCQGRKIASIGIAVRNWISFHGMSINIENDDLTNFSLINPCGMNIGMISIEAAAGRRIITDDVKDNLVAKFKRVFGEVYEYD